MTDAERLETYADHDVLTRECVRYGLPVPPPVDNHPAAVAQREADGRYLRVLLRHIYNNRDAVFGAKDSLIEAMRADETDTTATLRAIYANLREANAGVERLRAQLHAVRDAGQVVPDGMPEEALALLRRHLTDTGLSQWWEAHKDDPDPVQSARNTDKWLSQGQQA